MINQMSQKADRPQTEVAAKAKRRRFTADYKKRILQEAATCNEHGAIGALLRREGIYSSHLFNWKQQAAAGLQPKKRGRKSAPVDPQAKQVATLLRQNELLRKRAERAEALVAIQ